MKIKLSQIILCIWGVLFIPATLFAQGTTTASFFGKITTQDAGPLVGATVKVVHNPTGARYGAISRKGGNFDLPNLKVGGPYSLVINYVGYEEVRLSGIFLNLGEKRRVNVNLIKKEYELDEVVISTRRTALGTEKTGAETSINEQQINTLPTIARDLTDYTRLTPQATLTEDEDGELGFSVAGQNNRFNSIFFDGAISNDVFGLTDQGTNGGQAGISPISIDAIEQFYIVVAPYDVTIGGFTGAGVNAVTRSGSNELEASLYYLFRNEYFAGKTPTDNPTRERERLADFNSWIGGLRVGGPIIKDKLFFFLNAELERRTTPQPFNFADYSGDTSQDAIEGLVNTLQGQYGYDPGIFLDNPSSLEAEKFLAKLDWNIGDNNQLSFRHSYSRGRALKTNPSDRATINFSNSFEFFPSVTHSTAIELNSLIGTLPNKLIVGFTTVRDDRDPLGDPFPRVAITDGLGTINFGSEEFSTANRLEQDIFTLTNNLRLYRGDHSLTFGTHNEFYSIFNLFVRQNYGRYDYNSLSDFLADARPSLYARSYALRPDGTVENAVGDAIQSGTADLQALQLGFYAQDEWKIKENFALLYGLRLDIPIFLDNPAEDEVFNNTAVPQIEQIYGLEGARAGQIPGTQLLLSPRLGFNYDIFGNEKTVLRGGFGLFTSRLPFVWIGGAFTNNGISVGGVFETDPDVIFQPDPANQYTAADFGDIDVVPSGQVDIFVKNLKYPQVFRASIGIDQKLPWGMIGNIEFIYTKTINTLIYRNVNLKPAAEILDGADNRPYFNLGDEVVSIGGASPYSRILLGENTSKGYTINLTASVEKPLDNGLRFGLAYNFGYAEGLNDLTSSQNSSQWRNVEVGPYGKNELAVSHSDFSMGHRIISNAAYTMGLGPHADLTISAFYNGQSGEVFSYVYGGRARGLSNQDSRDFTDLIYVPANVEEIEFVGTANEQIDQWNALDAYIEQDKYLRERRGTYAQRNATRTPATHIVDLKLIFDFKIMGSEKYHHFQFSADIFNFTNLLNKDWGRRYRPTFNGIQLIQFEGFENRGASDLQPVFSFDESTVTNAEGNIETKARLNIDDTGLLSSRWQGQLGIRYIF